MDRNLRNIKLIEMTAEEFVTLIKEATEGVSCDNVHVGVGADNGQKYLLRGYKELAAYLKCSVPTACRMVTRGDIKTPAIIRSRKTLLFDPELVLKQLAVVDSRWQTRKDNKHN